MDRRGERAEGPSATAFPFQRAQLLRQWIMVMHNCHSQFNDCPLCALSQWRDTITLLLTKDNRNDQDDSNRRVCCEAGNYCLKLIIYKVSRAEPTCQMSILNSSCCMFRVFEDTFLRTRIFKGACKKYSTLWPWKQSECACSRWW